MDTEGKVGWEEIVDSQLGGKFDVQELNEVAALAYKCVRRAPRKRPSMRDIVQVLSRLIKLRHERKYHRHSLPATPDEFSIEMDSQDHRRPMSQHQRVESVDSTADASFEV